MTRLLAWVAAVWAALQAVFVRDCHWCRESGSGGVLLEDRNGDMQWFCHDCATARRAEVVAQSALPVHCRLVETSDGTWAVIDGPNTNVVFESTEWRAAYHYWSAAMEEIDWRQDRVADAIWALRAARQQ